MPNYIAIGDIHGMYAALEELLQRLPADGELVFLGDYIDRGPDAKLIVNRLLRLKDERPCRFLRGNHEEMALSALDGDKNAKLHWMMNGGLKTLESYEGRISPEHEAFFRRTLPFYETEHYIFVHAGLQPGSPPSAVGPDIYLWVREPFLNSNYDWGRLIIHGHTPLTDAKPDIRPNRINIDTGAVYGGALTALLLPEREFIAIPTTRP